MRLTRDKRPRLGGTHAQGTNGNLWDWLKSPSLFLLILPLLAGCNSIEGFPDRPEKESTALESLREKYFLPAIDVLDVYETKAEEAEKRNYRDKVIHGRLLALDLQYAIFKKAIYKEKTISDMSHSISGVVLGAAGAVVPGADASRILSALSGGLAGSQTAINKTLFYERTMPALLALMDAQRDTVRAEIMKGLAQDTSRYPLGSALSDLEHYLQAGSIPGALATVTATAGEKSVKAETQLETIRTKEFVDTKAQRDVDEMLSMADNLPAGAAWDILEKPPAEIDAFTSMAVRGRLGGKDLRNAQDLLSGEAKDVDAKATLKMVLALTGDRSPESISAWKAAMQSRMK